MVIIAIQRLQAHKWLEHVPADDWETDKTNTYGSYTRVSTHYWKLWGKKRNLMYLQLNVNFYHMKQNHKSSKLPAYHFQESLSHIINVYLVKIMSGLFL